MMSVDLSTEVASQNYQSCSDFQFDSDEGKILMIDSLDCSIFLLSKLTHTCRGYYDTKRLYLMRIFYFGKVSTSPF